jgi:hydroxyacylglutathione hydrolase
VFVETIAVGVFQCNCTVVACEDTGLAVVVDPGDEPDRILGVVRRHGWRVATVLHTHAHIDHIMGTLGVVDATGACARLHAADRPTWDRVGWVASTYGIPAPETPDLGEPLVDGEAIPFGRETLRVIHTPGHTPGSCCFAVETREAPTLLLSGDTLFRGRIGIDERRRSRCVDPRVNDTLLASIRNRLLTMDDDTRVVPGHGAATCIGVERQSNPFLSGRDHDR